MMLRTKSEQRAYLDGFEMCAECIENYLSDKGKQKLEGLLTVVRNAVEIEDTESLESVENVTTWIDTVDSGAVVAVTCAKCGVRYKTVELVNACCLLFKHCPNCGRKLV